MKKVIDGISYDTEKDKCLAEKTDYYGMSWSLRQTRSGNFYIHEACYYVSGKRKPYGMDIETFAPGCIIRDVHPRFRNDVEERHSIKPITRSQALVWCIRTQMPRTFHKELKRFI